MKDFDNYYNIVLNNLLADYLLLTHNLEEELEKYRDVLLGRDFIECFNTMLENVTNNSIGYPPVAQENGLRILKFISDNRDNDDTLDLEGKCFDKIFNMNTFSYEKYNTEYELKQNAISPHLDNPYIVWNLNDIEESLKYDYITLASLNCSDSEFLGTYYSEFILNKRFVYSLNKLFYALPDILSNSQFEKKIRTILRSNLKFINNIDADVEKIYLSHNFNLYDTVNNKEWEIFKEMNETALMTLKNLEKEPFSIDSLLGYYEFLKVENYLYLDDYDEKRVKLEDLNLAAICSYIDNIEGIGKGAKKRLIDALDSKKSILTKEEREEYYDYLGKVNSLPLPDENYQFKNFRKKTDVLTYLRVLISIQIGRDEKYEKISSIQNDLSNFETIIQNKDINDDFKYSVQRFITEFPPMFMNSKICDNVITILDKNNDYSSNVLKKRLLKTKNNIYK